MQVHIGLVITEDGEMNALVSKGTTFLFNMVLPDEAGAVNINVSDLAADIEFDTDE